MVLCEDVLFEVILQQVCFCCALAGGSRGGAGEQRRALRLHAVLHARHHLAVLSHLRLLLARQPGCRVCRNHLLHDIPSLPNVYRVGGVPHLLREVPRCEWLFRCFASAMKSNSLSFQSASMFLMTGCNRVHRCFSVCDLKKFQITILGLLGSANIAHGN